VCKGVSVLWVFKAARDRAEFKEYKGPSGELEHRERAALKAFRAFKVRQDFKA